MMDQEPWNYGKLMVLSWIAIHIIGLGIVVSASIFYHQPWPWIAGAYIVGVLAKTVEKTVLG
jgi:hypothetical protein